MSWVNDKYYYTKGVLRAIVVSYVSIYDDGLIIGDHDIYNLYSIAEFKADFDIALDAIGKGRWQGLNSHHFGSYRGFGKMQQIVIADILGIGNYELKTYGFYDIKQLRYEAYKRMLRILNENYS